MDSLVLETVIGLVFVFAVFAAVVSMVTEVIARFIGLRGEYLLRGLRTLLDGGGDFALHPLRTPKDPVPDGPALVADVLTGQLLGSFADKGLMPANAGNVATSNKDRRSLPSYLPSRAVAQSLIAVLVPDPQGATTLKEIRDGLANVEDARVRAALTQMVAQAEGDVARFRTDVEHWYDDQMDRVSGWYKRHVRWISLGIGVLLVLAFNLNAVTIARSLYTDEALRGAIVTEAADAATCGSKDPATCLTDLRTQVATFTGAGLPLGWGTVAACAIATGCNWGQGKGLFDPAPDAGIGSDVWFFLGTLAGWTLMVLTLLPGARFWFDALSRLGSLRSSGPKPERAPG